MLRATGGEVKIFVYEYLFTYIFSTDCTKSESDSGSYSKPSIMYEYIYFDYFPFQNLILLIKVGA